MDYGLRGKRRLGTVAILGLGALAIGIAAFSAWELRDFLQRRAKAIATASQWAVDGPPCPSLTPQQAKARGLKAPKAFEFEGVVMARRYGHANCAGVHTHGGTGLGLFPVCQFTGPGTLRVVTEEGEIWFDTGLGKPATVSTEGGKARCVLDSKFRLEGGRLTYG